MSILEAGGDAYLCCVGDDVWHKRLVRGWVACGDYVMVTQDFDIHFQEVGLENADLKGFCLGNREQELPFSRGEAHIYRSLEAPSTVDVRRLIQELRSWMWLLELVLRRKQFTEFLLFLSLSPWGICWSGSWRSETNAGSWMGLRMDL